MTVRLICVFILVILAVELAKLNPINSIDDQQQKRQNTECYERRSQGLVVTASPPKTYSQANECDPNSAKNNGEATIEISPFGFWLKNSHHEILSIFTIIIAGATVWLAAYTGRLWDATVRSVSEAKKSSERQLRAYVSVFDAKIEGVVSGETPIANITIKNFGQTPAYDLYTIAGIGMESEFNKLKMPS